MFLAYQLLFLLGVISYAVSALVTETAFQPPLGIFSDKKDKKAEEFISIKVSHPSLVVSRGRASDVEMMCGCYAD